MAAVSYCTARKEQVYSFCKMWNYSFNGNGKGDIEIEVVNNHFNLKVISARRLLLLRF